MSTAMSAYYALASQDAQGRRTVSPRIPCFPVDDAARISLADLNRRAAATRRSEYKATLSLVLGNEGNQEKAE